MNDPALAAARKAGYSRGCVVGEAAQYELSLWRNHTHNVRGARREALMYLEREADFSDFLHDDLWKPLAVLTGMIDE